MEEIKTLAKRKKQRKISLNLKKIDWEKAQKIFEKDKEDILEKLRKKTEEYPYAKEVLSLLAGGVVLAACLVFPNLPLVIKPLVEEWSAYDKRRLKQTIKRFKRQKLVEVVEDEDQMVVKITKNGIKRALSYKLEEMRIKKPAKWDRKWRLISFDIPHRKKKLRDAFREKIKQLGLYRLEESLYVYPYPCFKEVEFLRQIFWVGVNVRYIVAERIEEDEDLKVFFNLAE